MNKPLSLLLAAALAAACGAAAQAQAAKPDLQKQPWMNPALSPDERADLVLKQLTLDEKIELLHGNGMPGWGAPRPNWYLGNGGAGFTLGVPRLGIPAIQMSDAAYGVRVSGQNGRYSTALPSNLGSAASWNPDAACEYGALIGRELRAQGYNMTLGGGVDITREPRNGRTFEYMGEDPVLAGTLVGHRIRCEQAQHVIGDIKHYALNDQESGRMEVDAVLGKRAMRESDLLAFEIGIKVGDPQAVMCSYNAVNGIYACQNKYLLTDVLKQDWGFKGFVISDWTATHSTVASSEAGLDNEQPFDDFYGAKLKQAVESGTVPLPQLDDHARRVLRAEFSAGLVDHPQEKSVVDVLGGLAVARSIEEHSIVLLKNQGGILPLGTDTVHSIAVLGVNADTGMISGGGSAQVDAPGRPTAEWQSHVWFPTSPLKAIAAQAPGVSVIYGGSEPAAAAAAAQKADVAIVFAYQWESEDMDLPNLDLPDNQNALIEQVAAANPHTIVVLESGTAVTMPWAEKVQGIVEAWYAGSDGANALANVLFGKVNPSAKLPMTFPLSVADLPHPEIAKPPASSASAPADEAKPTFSVHYTEGVEVGYKWYDAQHKKVLFPFGYGLSYTTYRYSGLKVDAGKQPIVTFTITNTGQREGTEVAEVYAGLPAAAQEPPKRLVGWTRVTLAPGQSREVTVPVDPLYLSIYDEHSGWTRVPGQYTFMVGGSSEDLPLKQETHFE